MRTMQDDLVLALESVSVAECANDDGGGLMVATEMLQASVLSRFSQFLADNAAMAPSKESVLEMLSKAIDLAFAAANRPFISTLIKPAVKSAILSAAGNLYDSIFFPRTEV